MARQRVSALMLVILASALLGYGAGTEQFIPIGQSPGVSGTKSVLGRVVERSRGAPQFCVHTGLIKVCGTYSPAEPVYLDRSLLRQPNTRGSWADVQVGHVVEWWPGHWLKIRVED